jgi:hypothetical protein
MPKSRHCRGGKRIEYCCISRRRSPDARREGRGMVTTRVKFKGTVIVSLFIYPIYAEVVASVASLLSTP